MGTTKPSHHRAKTALTSKTSSHKPNPTNNKPTTVTTIPTTKPKQSPHLTPQERLQLLSMSLWLIPIDEALELHLHGRLTFSSPSDTITAKDKDKDKTKPTLAPDSWTKWPHNYCKLLLKLIPLVSAETANELLTRKLAGESEEGVQPWVVRRVLGDVKGAVVKKSGGYGKRGWRGKFGNRGGSGQGASGRVAK